MHFFPHYQILYRGFVIRERSWSLRMVSKAHSKSIILFFLLSFTFLNQQGCFQQQVTRPNYRWLKQKGHIISPVEKTWGNLKGWKIHWFSIRAPGWFPGANLTIANLTIPKDSLPHSDNSKQRYNLPFPHLESHVKSQKISLKALHNKLSYVMVQNYNSCLGLNSPGKPIMTRLGQSRFIYLNLERFSKIRVNCLLLWLLFSC